MDFEKNKRDVENLVDIGNDNKKTYKSLAQSMNKNEVLEDRTIDDSDFFKKLNSLDFDKIKSETVVQKKEIKPVKVDKFDDGVEYLIIEDSIEEPKEEAKEESNSIPKDNFEDIMKKYQFNLEQKKELKETKEKEEPKDNKELKQELSQLFNNEENEIPVAKKYMINEMLKKYETGVNDKEEPAEEIKEQPVGLEPIKPDTINNLENNKNEIEKQEVKPNTKETPKLKEEIDDFEKITKNFNEQLEEKYPTLKKLIDEKQEKEEIKEDAFDNISHELEEEILDKLEEPINIIEEPEKERVNISKDKLLETFIGKNYLQITNQKISIPTFLFGGIYFMYRKMYMLGIVLYTLLVLLIMIFMKSLALFIVIGANLLISLILGVLFRKIYLTYANIQIEKIKRELPDGPENKIIKYCKLRGGTSRNTLIAILIIVTAILLVLSPIFIPKGPANFFEQVKINNEQTDDDKTSGYMLFYDTNVYIKNDFSIKIPEEFVADNNYTYRLDYTCKLEKEENVDQCKLSFAAISSYTSSEKLISEMSKFYKGDSEITKTNINNITWYSFEYADTIGTKYYNATEYNGKVYLFSYEIETNNEDKICEKYYQEIMNTITTNR